MNLRAPPVALTIAGSDSGGGAGIQADLKTFHQWGVYGTSAVAAVTAQNTLGVQEAFALPPATVAAQIDSVAADLRPRAVKSGMLATAPIVRSVAGALRRHGLENYVLDPVMVATSGDPLLDPDAVAAICEELLPLAAVVTPNWPEALELARAAARARGGGWTAPEPNVRGMEAAARAISRAGARAVLVKGGHLPGEEVVDLFWDGSSSRVIRAPRIDTRRTHGTGCSLSAAIAAGLALGSPPEEAVERAAAWVRRAIAGAPALGAGRGPIDHFASTDMRGSSVSSRAPSIRPATAP